MKYFLIVFSISAIVVLFSCNKDKAAAKDIDGDWLESESKMMVGDSAISNISKLYDGGQFHFYSCNLKKEDYCDLLIQVKDSEDSIHISYPFVYQIKDDADSLLIKEGPADSSYYINRFRLESLGKDFLVLEKALGGDTFLKRVFVRM